MRARSGDVETELKTVTVGTKREFTFALRSPSPHAIRGGWLTVATRSPCTGGAEAAGIVVDDGRTPGTVLPPGQHDVAVRLAEGGRDLVLDTVIDLSLDDGVCVRTPAVSQVIPLAAPAGYVLLISDTIQGNAEMLGLGATFSLGLGAGRWLGPVLLTAEAGVGVAQCNIGTCGKKADGSVYSGLAIPASLDARVKVGSTVTNRVINYGFVGGRYGFTSVSLPAAGVAPERHFGVHTAQAQFIWGLADAGRGPFVGSERTNLVEFAFPIGVMIGPDTATRRLVFTGGIALRFVMAL